MLAGSVPQTFLPWFNVAFGLRDLDLYRHWIDVNITRPRMLEQLHSHPHPSLLYVTSPAPWRFFLGLAYRRPDTMVQPLVLFKNVALLTADQLASGPTKPADHEIALTYTRIHNGGLERLLRRTVDESMRGEFNVH